MLYVFESVSQLVGLPVGLLAALCSVESTHNPNAINPADGGRSSFGLCQIKYATAQEVMPDIKPSQLFQAQSNAMAAALYLKKKLDKYKNIDRAIAAYNKGHVKYIEGKLSNLQYVKKVKKAWRLQKMRISIAKVCSDRLDHL
jgi:soluble lytic murein transglycosylase-like protein